MISAWRDNNRIRIEGSAVVVDAAMATGVGRLVPESVVMVYPDRGSRWTDEDVPPERYPMAEANLAAETNTRRFTQGGGTGNVLRFGWFYGPGAAHSEEMFTEARHHVGLVVGRPDGTVNLSSPRAIFAGSPPRFTRSRVTYEAYAVSRTSTRPQVDSADRRTPISIRERFRNAAACSLAACSSASCRCFSAAMRSSSRRREACR